MHTRNPLLALSLAFAFSGAAFAQAAPANTGSPMTEANVRALLSAQGYTGINDVEFKEGMWTADAKSADGNHVEVKVDNSGKIIPDQHVATIGKDQIIVMAQQAGYKNVHDVDFEGGVWKVEANMADGTDVELKMDPNDGHILGSSADKVQNHGATTDDTAEDNAERAARDDTAEDNAERAARDDAPEEHH
jgi:hypothetical protein